MIRLLLLLHQPLLLQRLLPQHPPRKLIRSHPPLPRRQRRIVQLHYFGNVSQRGIASQLGLSQVHVSRLLNDSLGKLRREIGQT